MLATLAVFAVSLWAYRSKRIRVTPKFQRGVMIALGGYLVFVLVNLLFQIFGSPRQPVRLPAAASSASLIGLFAVGLAAFCLILDFDFIEQGVKNGLPARFAWTAAFGLVVTLVWLYIEMLRCSPSCAASSPTPPHEGPARLCSARGLRRRCSSFEGALGPAQVVLVHDRRGVAVGEAVLVAQPAHAVVEAQERGARFEGPNHSGSSRPVAAELGRPSCDGSPRSGSGSWWPPCDRGAPSYETCLTGRRRHKPNDGPDSGPVTPL